jgi:hypothetical protein
MDPEWSQSYDLWLKTTDTDDMDSQKQVLHYCKSLRNTASLFQQMEKQNIVTISVITKSMSYNINKNCECNEMFIADKYLQPNNS